MAEAVAMLPMEPAVAVAMLPMEPAVAAQADMPSAEFCTRAPTSNYPMDL
jgi:hypothetical protein